MAQIFRSLPFCVHSTQNFRDKPLICWSLEFPWVPYVPAAAPSLRGASIGSKGLPSEAAAPAPARCPTSRRPSAPSLMVQSRIGARGRCDPRGSSRNGWREMLILFCMQHLASSEGGQIYATSNRNRQIYTEFKRQPSLPALAMRL